MGHNGSKAKATNDLVPPTPTPTPVTATDTAVEKKKCTLLLCGPCESGKTTFVNQMKFHFCGGISASEKQRHFAAIRGNLIETMQLLIRWARCNSEDFSFEADIDAVGNIESTPPFDTFDARVAEDLRSLWNDPAIQEAFENRDMMDVPDHMSYFFDKLDDLEDDGYDLQKEDVLKARVHSCDQITFDVESLNLEVTLVDYHKSHRWVEWDPVPPKIDGLIFFSSLADFAKPMLCEQYKPRMIDSLECFEDFVHRSTFKNKPIFLICNKIDGFKTKIEDSKEDLFTKVFDDYTGDCHNTEQCYKFICDKFMEQAKGSEARYIKIFSQNSIDDVSAAENAQAIFKMIAELE